MGFLEIGEPLTWIETRQIRDKIKKDGLTQLLHVYHINKNRQDRDLKWGEELEFTLVNMDEATKTARICIDGPKFLAELEAKELSHSWTASEIADATGSKSVTLRGAVWHPEFGRHMVESTPNPPYDLTLNSLLEIETSMTSRRQKLQSILPSDVFAVSITCFPRLGLADTIWSIADATVPPASSPERQRSCGMSVFLPDAIICAHPRFPTLVRNITTRRQCKSVMFIPIFQDSHTSASAAWEKSMEVPANASPSAARRLVAQRSTATLNPIKDQIFMDHFGFGMCMSCLQMTFGTPDLSTARFLYDQMAVFAPIMLALSAATPCLRGFLSDYDARWKVLEQGCDDRTDDELDSRKLQRTRYGPVSYYIGEDEYLRQHESQLNDVSLPLYEPGLRQLIAGGMDKSLATHFSSLWIRDPLVVFNEKIDLDNTTVLDHFENIQSTNWNSVRFKPPPAAVDGKSPSQIGWRVELRTCDIQLSDFENACLAALSNLLAMAIVQKRWSFYMPISQTHENMDTAHLRDAVHRSLFWFPIKATSSDTEDDSCRSASSDSNTPRLIPTSQMTLREIFLGSKRTGFEGLIPMLDRFVSEQWRSGANCSRGAVEKYRQYMNYIRLKVLGQAPTNAAVLRHFVRSHASYEGDSVVSAGITYDLCRLAISSGSPNSTEAVVGSEMRQTSQPRSMSQPNLSGELFGNLFPICRCHQLPDALAPHP